MTWLVQAGFFERRMFEQLYVAEQHPERLYARLFANPNDTRLTQPTIATLPPGAICNFFDANDRLHHSMVALGGDRLAGTNNGGVGGALGFDTLTGTNLPWHDEGTTVGATQERYRVFWCTTDDVVVRFATACVPLADAIKSRSSS